jgi:LPS-assembly protein
LDLFGNNWIQTLEPRAFFVYTPYRDQNSLPVYDSAKYDFNFASIFLENAFSGNDRISDSKVLTLGGSSQLIDAQSGFEVARIGAAQRIQLRDQDIYLPSNPVPSTGRFSDFLVGGSLNLNERWKMGSIYEYNPQTSQSDLSSLDITHSPSNYRLINFEYRYDRLLSADMIGAGWQWPINDLWGDRGKDLGPGRGLGEDRWYTLGRINYNKDTGQIGDLIIGIEYDAGCWLGRLVLEKLQITSATANQSIMLQIEIDGVSRAGSNPLSALRNYLPRYQNLRNPLADPSRYVNYQ